MALKSCKNVKIPVYENLSKEHFEATFFKEGKPRIHFSTFYSTFDEEKIKKTLFLFKVNMFF